MDIGAALTIALLAVLLGQVWAAQVRIEHQLRWQSAVLLLSSMSLPAAMLLFGDSNSVLSQTAGFMAILLASASGLGALIWLYRIEKLERSARSPTQDEPQERPQQERPQDVPHG